MNSPSQDLFAICGCSQGEYTKPSLVWTTTAHTHIYTHRETQAG